MSQTTIAPTFGESYENGEVIEESGYHQPDEYRSACDSCKNTTRKGAYRDVIVDYDNKRIVYYHQNPIAVKHGGKTIISSCGYRTITTKERINRHLPKGYRLYQEDFEWYVSKPDGTELTFRDGMQIDGMR